MARELPEHSHDRGTPHTSPRRRDRLPVVFRRVERKVTEDVSEELMNLATELRQLVAASGSPVEFAQGSYRLRVMPGVGRIRDINFSIWEGEGAAWEPILAGWVRGDTLIVSTSRPPGSPANAETLVRFVLAGKRLFAADGPRFAPSTVQAKSAPPVVTPPGGR
jgi:hypothetical protein